MNGGSVTVCISGKKVFIIQIYLDLETDGGMIRNTSSLGDILDTEHPDLHLTCKSGYSEDNILAESETVECDLAVSLVPKDCQTRLNLPAKEVCLNKTRRD